MKITVGTALKFVGEMETVLSASGVLDATGNFAQPVSPEAIAKAAADIERGLVAYGVNVPAEVDKAFQALPLLLPLILSLVNKPTNP